MFHVDHFLFIFFHFSIKGVGWVGSGLNLMENSINIFLNPSVKRLCDISVHTAKIVWVNKNVGSKNKKSEKE